MSSHKDVTPTGREFPELSAHEGAFLDPRPCDGDVGLVDTRVRSRLVDLIMFLFALGIVTSGEVGPFHPEQFDPSEAFSVFR